jgi:hypothetical protein
MSTFRQKIAFGVLALAAVPFLTGARLPNHFVPAATSNMSANQLIAAAEVAMKNATSFHVQGTVHDQGTESFNLSLSRTGGGGSVTVNGATLQIVVAKNTLYIKADEESWYRLTNSKSTAQLVANRWIKVPASSANFADFADLTIVKDFSSQFLTGVGKVSKLPGTVMFNGHKAFVITDSQADKLYIAATGTPYVLRVQGHGNTGSLTFTEFGDAAMPATPTNAIPLPG